MSMIAHSSSSLFSIGVPVIASRRRASMRRSARARFVAGFLTSCASSRRSRSQRDGRERIDVPRRDVVRRDDEVARPRHVGELAPAQALAAMVDMHPQGRCEPLRLARPLPGHAHRADDQGRAEGVRSELLPLGCEHRDRLNGLPEAHVVGEDRADAEVAEHPQPAVPALLEREERLGHRGGGPERLEAPRFPAGEEIAQRVVERDLAQLQPGVLQLDARDGAHEVDDRALAPPLQEAQRPLHLGAAQCVPAPTDADQRLLRGGEIRELRLRQGRIADRELPVEASEGIGREQAARVGDARGGEVDAQPARGRDPVPREEHGYAELLQPRNRAPQYEPDVVVRQLDRGRGGRVEGQAALREHRPDQPELAMDRRPRIGRAEEAEDGVAAVLEQRGGQGQRGVVGGLEPELEHDARPRRRGALVVAVLVQPQGEQPRCARAPFEAGVDPAREPPLERREPCVRRQLGLRRGEPVEEQLRRARPAAHEAVAEPDPGRAEAVARDLVDRAGVEVVDERVRRRRRTHRRRRPAGPRRSRRASPAPNRRSSRPSRRATCGRRAAAAGGAGPPSRSSRRQLEDGERRPGRAAGVEVRRRTRRERDQLLEADAACRWRRARGSRDRRRRGSRRGARRPRATRPAPARRRLR